MKKLITATLIAVMLLNTSVFAATGIVYEGENIEFASQEPVILNDRTYVPIRDVFETLGFAVSWDPENKVVGLTKNGKEYEIDTINNKISNNDGYAQPLTDKVVFVNGRTMLPLRGVLEYMGYTLFWNSETKTSTIYEFDVSTADDIFKFENVYDSSKPEGSLSESEIEWLENYYKVVDEVVENYNSMGEKYSSEKYENMSDEAEKEAVKELVADWHSKITLKMNDITSVEAPESLKDFERGNIQYFAIVENYISAMTEEATQNVDLNMLYAQATITNLYVPQVILYNLYADNNINYKKLFNTEYATAFIAIFGAMNIY